MVQGMPTTLHADLDQFLDLLLPGKREPTNLMIGPQGIDPFLGLFLPAMRDM